ncbi:MAG: rhombosortase [Phycisphaerae bacterium]|nr:rhombosortase [Phycisphaerae bacterium]
MAPAWWQSPPGLSPTRGTRAACHQLSSPERANDNSQGRKPLDTARRQAPAPAGRHNTRTRSLAHSVSAFTKTAWLSLALSIVAVLVFASDGVTRSLEYGYGDLLGGQMWRLLTCHWTHWTADHLLWDVAMFAALGVACERLGRRTFVTCLTLAALAIPLALFCFEPAVQIYRGLSGLDAALFALLITRLFQLDLRAGHYRRPLILTTMALALVAKITWEYTTGTAIFVPTTSTFDVVPLAHVVGAGMGLVVALARLSRVASAAPLTACAQAASAAPHTPLAAPPSADAQCVV